MSDLHCAYAPIKPDNWYARRNGSKQYIRICFDEARMRDRWLSVDADKQGFVFTASDDITDFEPGGVAVDYFDVDWTDSHNSPFRPLRALASSIANDELGGVIEIDSVEELIDPSLMGWTLADLDERADGIYAISVYGAVETMELLRAIDNSKAWDYLLDLGANADFVYACWRDGVPIEQLAENLDILEVHIDAWRAGVPAADIFA